jgi:hypothetical protein
MPKQGKRTTRSEPVDEASAESFPASDPPSWTLGAGAEAGVGSAVPGMVTTPAPRAAVTAGPLGAGDDPHPTPAELVPRAPGLATVLVSAGAVVAAAGLVTSLAGQGRSGRALGRAGTTLVLIGLFARLGALVNGLGEGDRGQSYH